MSYKLIKKLSEKKYREETGLFLVEGKKSIEELLRSSFRIHSIYATLESLSSLEEAAKDYEILTQNPYPEIICVTEEKLSESGTFRSNNAGIAIAYQREPVGEDTLLQKAQQGRILVLDEVRDPGNLGTIIRTADWFGISHIIVSETTTDAYNPKVIAASMGSFTRITVSSLPLALFLEKAVQLHIPCIGAFLEGKNVYEGIELPHGLILMGSESHGIRPELAPFVTEKITIPSRGGAESLNVGVATGIILALISKN